MNTIFLVDSIGDFTFHDHTYREYPITLSNQIAKEKNIKTAWMTEIIDLLKCFNMKFESLSTVSVTGLSPHFKYYYFTNFIHEHEFDPEFFLRIPDEQRQFLINNQIPIIIDNSVEQSLLPKVHAFQQKLKNLKNKLGDFIKLQFYYVHGTYFSAHSNYALDKIFDSNINYVFFPACYFYYGRTDVRWTNSEIISTKINLSHNHIISLFENIENKKILNKQHLWESYSHEPRLSRILFQAGAEFFKLTNFGRYSRLQPYKKALKEQISCIKPLTHRLKYFTKKFFLNLDKTYQIDELDHNNFPKYFQLRTQPDDYMFRVVTETNVINNVHDLTCTNSMLTEKVSSAIVLCTPLITLGGQHLKDILNYYNFIEYPYLELSNEPCLLDEIDYIFEKMQTICAMNLDELNDLFADWKEIAICNFKNYYNLNPAIEYLKALHNENILHLVK